MRRTTHSRGLDVLGAPVRGADVIGAVHFIGMVDMQTVQRNLNDLRPVTVEIARILLRTGQDVINKAITGAKQPWYKADLPGNTARDKCFWALKWHADNLLKFTTAAPYSAYPDGGDLKKWVAQAFVEENAVEEGAAYLDAAWNQMWSEIRSELSRIPADAMKKLLGGVNSAVQAVTGVPIWGWALIAVGVVGAVGGIAYGIRKWRQRVG